MPNSLYFIALIPPEPLKSQVHDLKLEMKQRYNSSHALNAPSHITLLSPFRMDDADRPEVLSLLEEWANGQPPLEVELHNFSTFPPRVLFIDVVLSEELSRLQQSLEDLARSHSRFFRYNYAEREFHPHMTLAFKDLSKSNFHRAWKEFEDKTFSASFIADHLYILKHDGEQWLVDQSYPLDL